MWLLRSGRSGPGLHRHRDWLPSIHRLPFQGLERVPAGRLHTPRAIPHKKHTSGLDLRKVVPPAIDLYLEKAGAFVLDIEMMKNIELTDAEAKAIIFDTFAFELPIMNRRMLPEVAHTYFRDERQREWFPDRSLWSLNNAFTQVVKELPINPQNAANIAIGRAFARIVRSRRAAVRDVALDADVQLPSDN